MNKDIEIIKKKFNRLFNAIVDIYPYVNTEDVKGLELYHSLNDIKIYLEDE